MSRVLMSVFLCFTLMLYWIAIRPDDHSDVEVGANEALEVVSFTELPAKDGDDFRYCELGVRYPDGSVKTLRLKAKKTLVAESIGGFAKNMLLW